MRNARPFKIAFNIFTNKYFLAAVLFCVWMLFFDPKEWGLIVDRQNKLKDLQKSEQTLKTQISETKEELSLLKTNTKTIEKYAREKYYMKKDNEEIFIVKEP